MRPGRIVTVMPTIGAPRDATRPGVMPRLPRRRPGSRATLAFPLAWTATSAFAASGDRSAEWVPWIVLAAIALFVVGLLLRTILAARFPKGYRSWASRNSESFAARNEAWERQDDEFRK